MADERKFSALKSVILEKLQTHAVIPIDFSKLNDASVMELGLTNFLHTHVLPFNLHVKLGQIIDNLFAAHPDKKIEWNMNDDLAAIAWIISYGIVDDKGEPIFNETEAVMFSSKYKDLTYYLCWEVLHTNGYTTPSSQSVVGNSEGTKV